MAELPPGVVQHLRVALSPEKAGDLSALTGVLFTGSGRPGSRQMDSWIVRICPDTTRVTTVLLVVQRLRALPPREQEFHCSLPCLRPVSIL